ncbi:hypothetical protein EVAR_89107_1 [Eumeta japonica]|uniref:Uncharacterized protein n=1 Tax=Eumeta variegata TaxID=151549 RepID=A0A4C1XHN7_EUMVA|nr:hypothetical protein EVAR_89107_1 [Eumeta japonica]
MQTIICDHLSLHKRCSRWMPHNLTRRVERPPGRLEPIYGRELQQRKVGKGGISKKGHILSTRNRGSCMIRLRDIREAREIYNDRTMWKSIVSAYPSGKQALEVLKRSWPDTIYRRHHRCRPARDWACTSNQKRTRKQMGENSALSSFHRMALTTYGVREVEAGIEPAAPRDRSMARERFSFAKRRNCVRDKWRVRRRPRP